MIIEYDKLLQEDKTGWYAKVVDDGDDGGLNKTLNRIARQRLSKQTTF